MKENSIAKPKANDRTEQDALIASLILQAESLPDAITQAQIPPALFAVPKLALPDISLPSQNQRETSNKTSRKWAGFWRNCQEWLDLPQNFSPKLAVLGMVLMLGLGTLTGGFIAPPPTPNSSLTENQGQNAVLEEWAITLLGPEAELLWKL